MGNEKERHCLKVIKSYLFIFVSCHGIRVSVTVLALLLSVVLSFRILDISMSFCASKRMPISSNSSLFETSAMIFKSLNPCAMKIGLYSSTPLLENQSLKS